jgi:hypothetical protein
MPRVYIAGPMTGLPEYNYPAFHAAAEAWRAEGWEVANPAEHFDGDQTLPYNTYMRAGVAALTDCDLIAFLPDWEKSAGSQRERTVAKVLDIPEWKGLKPMLLHPYEHHVCCLLPDWAHWYRGDAWRQG